MRYYCTYFDHRFISRGLALLSSLEQHGKAFRLFVLCLDDLCYDALIKARLPNVSPIALPDIEAYDRDLRATRPRRSLVEYYFTLTPAFPLYLLAHFPEIDIITYLDSDLYFFGDPETVFTELGGGSAAIIGHRFSEAGRFRERYGVYNVGWVSWRRDQSGLACLEWYREKCLEWCFDNADGQRFADQKYLDDWPLRFPRVRAIQHKGCNLAPWNIENYEYSLRNGRLFIDGDPIVFYHFHGLKNPLEVSWENTGIESYLTGPVQFDSQILLDHLYRPYAAAMQQALTQTEGFKINSPPRVELRHTGSPPSALSGEPWREYLDWKAADGPVEPAKWLNGHDATTPGAVKATIRQPADGELLTSLDVGGLLLEHASHLASRRGLQPLIISEDVFEQADWQHELEMRLDGNLPLVIHGVRTFTSTPTTCVLRRPITKPESKPVWVVQRAALLAFLEAQGYRVEKEFIWPESVSVASLPERADRRTLLLVPS
jgi:hypothetical protein